MKRGGWECSWGGRRTSRTKKITETQEHWGLWERNKKSLAMFFFLPPETSSEIFSIYSYNNSWGIYHSPVSPLLLSEAKVSLQSQCLCWKFGFWYVNKLLQLMDNKLSGINSHKKWVPQNENLIDVLCRRTQTETSDI